MCADLPSTTRVSTSVVPQLADVYIVADVSVTCANHISISSDVKRALPAAADAADVIMSSMKSSSRVNNRQGASRADDR